MGCVKQMEEQLMTKSLEGHMSVMPRRKFAMSGAKEGRKEGANSRGQRWRNSKQASYINENRK